MLLELSRCLLFVPSLVELLPVMLILILSFVSASPLLPFF